MEVATAPVLFRFGEPKFDMCGSTMNNQDLTKRTSMVSAFPLPDTSASAFSLSLGDMHCVVVSDLGRAYAGGSNSRGQCGQSAGETWLPRLAGPIKLGVKVLVAACGAMHSALLCMGT